MIYNLSLKIATCPYCSLNPRNFILHALKDPLIFAEFTHYLFIAPYDRVQRRQKYCYKMIWKPLWPLKIPNNSQQPTFYAIHAVSLRRFSFAATKHLLGQIHFQANLCKNTGLWQFTRDQNTTMFKMAALRLNTSVTSSTPANHLSRERKQIFSVFTWPRSGTQGKPAIFAILTSEHLMESLIW